MHWKFFMFLLLAAICKGKGNIFCDFKENLCSWSNIYRCKFMQETKIPLAGKKGYLHLSNDTCNLAAISVSMKSENPKLGFHYFFNGTGRADIYVYGTYLFLGRNIVWHCSVNQGPKWNTAEIHLQSHFFNPLQNIIIEVNILGDVIVAIGRVESPKHGRNDHQCPSRAPSIKPTTKKHTTYKATTKRQSKHKTTPANAGRNHTICNFELDLCKWRDISRCHFKHVKDTPLLGETGYLMLSKDTCKKAALLITLKEFNFQLHYLMNGTGDMSLSLGVNYGFSGRDQLWSCSASQGPKWNKVDIKVHLKRLDPRINVYINAEVHGDAVIAIGNILNAGGGSKETKCPSGPRNLTTTTSPTSRRTQPRDPTSGDMIFDTPVMTETTTNDPQLTTTSHQSLNSVQPTSTAISNHFLPGTLNQSSKVNSGAIIGASVAGAIFAVVIVVFIIFMYKRKIRMWDVHRSITHEIESAEIGFDNPLYNQ